LSILPARTPYYAYRAGATIARFVPDAIGAPVARGIAQLAPAVLASRRAQVERNLRRIHGAQYGGAELHRDVTATFDSYGRYFYELFRLPSYPQAWIDEHFVCHGIDQVAAAVAEDRGAVLALPHLGNWDFAGAWLAGQGFTVTVVAEPLEPRELFDWFVATRARLGMRVIPLSPSAGTEVLHALRANEVVCLVADRDLGGDGIDVEFFGERTTLPGGPAMLALRSGSPLFAAGCYFQSAGAHVTRILPPLDTARTGRIRDDMARVTQELADRFEDLIRAAPTHWHLLQPNWPSDRAAPGDSDCAHPGTGMG
jgi:KDO2-lipid IV(A) lauroyltransferase